jgi:hypothetical protein
LLISSAIVKDVTDTRDSKSDLVAYYYFDPEDAATWNVWGLLASLVVQLATVSDRCCNVLSQIYLKSSVQPRVVTLSRCLTRMIELLGQDQVTIVMDGVDHCPNIAPYPAREAVLMLVDELVRSRRSNLYICITSSSDITTTLRLSTTRHLCVTLHAEAGHKEEIKGYIRSFIQSDKDMQKWAAEDINLVIDKLSERANGI